jgi:hypothetical protein
MSTRPRTTSNTSPNTAPFAACTTSPSRRSPNPTSRTSEYSQRNNRWSIGSSKPQIVAAAAPATAARTRRFTRLP